MSEAIVNQVIEGRVVVIDREHLIDCVVRNCTLTYSGGSVTLIGCDFQDCKLNFEGAAANTVALLLLLLSMPGDGALARDLQRMLGLPA